MQDIVYLIVGGGVAGTTAAETIRHYDRESSVAIVSDEPYYFYSRILLSKPSFFLGKIPFERIWLKQESWYRENAVRLLYGKKAVKLDADKKETTLDDGSVIRYAKLLLAPGGIPRKWDIPGADTQGIFYLRNLDDAKAIMEAVKNARQGLAVGGGFIGFEMSELMRLAGMEATVILREPYYWAPLLDETSARMIETALLKNGVRILRQSEVKEIGGAGRVEHAVLQDGTVLPCDMIVVGIGIVYPFEWVKAAGILVNKGILTDAYLKTNMKDIWAAGDAAEFEDLVIGERVQLGNWVNAQMQGKIAALNMLGKKEPFRMVSFYTTQGFDLKIAFVGNVKPGPDRTVISRGSDAINSYGRLIVKEERVVGATLINRTQELSLISKLIEQKIKVAGYEQKLKDPLFNLSGLLAV